MGLKLGSLFDGIGAFPLAATMHGIEPVWASEIEKFPIAVTSKHFPQMNHLGDITKINGAEIEPVDIITAGSPCVDLSIAGRRAGLKGSQSSLFLHFIRIVREMRNATDNKFPRIILWENVPGAFSSNRGQDFRTVLEEIAEAEIPMPKSGKWADAGMVRGAGRSIAWRVLDAQHHNVPQRRKRIFLVADFAGQSAPEILFESQSVPRNPAESGEAGEEVAGSAGDGTTTASGTVVESVLFEPRSQDGVLRIHDNGIVPTLDTAQGGQRQPCVASFTPAQFGQYKEGVGTLRSSGGDNGGGSETLLYRVQRSDSYTVRRLTPTECERLQGFPDNWTNIPSASDTGRYKALGNSVAVPCVAWIIGRIKEATQCEK